MNKFMIAMMSVFLTISCVTSQKGENDLPWGNISEFAYANIKGYIYNDVWKKMNEVIIRLNVNPQKNRVQLYFKDYLNLNCVKIDNNDRSTLVDIIKKYTNWHSMALKSKDKIEKEIGEYSYRLSWLSGDEWHAESEFNFVKSKCSVIFFSQSSTVHQMVFQFSKSAHYDNEYITKKPETIYFNYDDAVSLLKSIQLNFILNKISVESSKNEKLEKYK